MTREREKKRGPPFFLASLSECSPSPSPHPTAAARMAASSTPTQAQTHMLEDEAISTLSAPLPLPPYEGTPGLSEDENMLVWVSILARHSSSRKGHMGTIFVRPPQVGDASDAASQCEPPLSTRVAAYANNTPLLHGKNPKAIPEIHAEALAISRSAARGVPLQGCTVYISFPPCNECFKLLIAAGIKRCVFKKGIPVGDGHTDAVMVAAEVHGIEMVGTLDAVNASRRKNDKQGEEEGRAKERKQDDERDARVRAFWAAQGEDASKTRARVQRWWEDWLQRYKAAERVVHDRWNVKSASKKRTNVRASVQADGDGDELTNAEPSAVVPCKRSSDSQRDTRMAGER